MKIRDGSLGVDEETTPDERTDTTQGNLQLVNNGIWWVEHGTSLADFLSSLLPHFLADSSGRGAPKICCRTRENGATSAHSQERKGLCRRFLLMRYRRSVSNFTRSQSSGLGNY